MKSKSGSNRNKAPRLPKTGRIGRFAKIVEEKAGLIVAERVMGGAEEYKSFSNAEKAAWWRGAIERLLKEVGEEITYKIMEACGRRCCGLTSRKRAKRLMKESKSIAEFVSKLNSIGLGGGRLKLEDQNTVRGGYDRCYCGQVKQTREPFPNTDYCHCSVGWYKQLFESALEKPVQVEILQSIVSGAETCEFMIHI